MRKTTPAERAAAYRAIKRQDGESIRVERDGSVTKVLKKRDETVTEKHDVTDNRLPLCDHPIDTVCEMCAKTEPRNSMLR